MKVVKPEGCQRVTEECPRATVRGWLDWPWQLRWVVLVAYAGFVAWVSLSPAETFAGIPAVLLRFSKAVHFLLYGVMVSLARWAMAAHWAVRPAFLVVVVGASAYGSLMEVLQGALVRYHRTFEFGDIVANTLGALCFWWISGQMLKYALRAEIGKAESRKQKSGGVRAETESGKC